MANLSELAQNIMDLYYQQYKSDEDFFELYHFEYLSSVAFSKLLQDEYEKSYKMSLAERGIGQAQINPQWFKTEERELVASEMGDKEIVLDQCPFTFRFDKQSTGIQNIYPLNGKCGDFIRLTIDELWKLKNVPDTDIVWWIPVGNKILFKNLKCGLKKVHIIYIPSFDLSKPDKCMLTDSAQADIIDWVLQRMFAARQGSVIDMTADQNANKVIETEINTAFRNLKTKP